MNALAEIVLGALTLTGALVIFVSAIGLLRLPDALCRAHALGKGMTLGISLLLLTLWLRLGTDLAGLKVLAAVFFQFLTIPVASHLLARVVVERGYPRHGRPEVDEDRTDRRPDQAAM
jgi:multicomponent Na+:H+ antiporter subunit G